MSGEESREKMSSEREHEISPEEIEAQQGADLPDREAMTVLTAPPVVAVPVPPEPVTDAG